MIARQPAAGGDGELNLVDPGAVINDAQAGAFAEGFQQENRIKAQVVQTEVLNAINQARRIMSTDPDAASQNLQLMLQNVRQQADLNPDVRDQLSDQLRTALREAARRKVEVEFHRQQQQESMAAARERQLITDNLLHNQQRLKQLMDRFDSLMDESRYQMFELDQTKAREAEEQAADEAMKLAPSAGAGSSGDIRADGGILSGTDGGSFDAAKEICGHDVPGRYIGHSIPGRRAHRVSFGRGMAAIVGPAFGKRRL